jgi:hypothetical protein
MVVWKSEEMAMSTCSKWKVGKLRILLYPRSSCRYLRRFMLYVTGPTACYEQEHIDLFIFKHMYKGLLVMKLGHVPQRHDFISGNVNLKLFRAMGPVPIMFGCIDASSCISANARQGSELLRAITLFGH